MRIAFILLVLVLAGAACSPTRKSIAAGNHSFTASDNTGRDALSYETAIIIQEKSETAGVQAEYKWIAEHYSGYTIEGQSLTTRNKKPFDIIHIKLADGTKKDLYFDISNFFGRF